MSVRESGGVVRVGAVIVSYFPDDAFAERVQRIAKQVAVVIIVDNSAATDVHNRLRSMASERIEIVENARNEGVAHALNQGMIRAVERRCSWVITLDQDSNVDLDLIPRLLAIQARAPYPNRIGLIHSNARSKLSGVVAVHCPDPDAEFAEAKTVVTSGSLISVDAYRAAGRFLDELFIEGVDLEYCLRLRRAGFRILLSCRPRMVHAAGRMEEHKWGRRTVVVANHAPWRYYYMTRNLFRIIGAYATREPLWCLTALFNLGKTIAKVLVFEDRRLAKLGCMAVGARDAFTGFTGVKFVPGRS